jgi:mono/diheme cytochrome c family protein
MWRAILAVMLVVSEPWAQAEDLPTAQQLQGERLFAATCQYCHAANGWATRDLARRGEAQATIDQRADLSPGLIRGVLRHGVGNMPAFTPTDLSDAQIDALIAWLARPRRPGA